MNQIDIAGKSYRNQGDKPGAHHYVAAIGRAVRVHGTSFDLSPGDLLDGPPLGQLLVVSESTAGPEVADRVASTAVDTVVRTLLRDNGWLIGLIDGRLEPVEEGLSEAMSDAAKSVAAHRGDNGPAEKQAESPEVAMTAALVAWPAAAVAHVGDGGATLFSGESVIQLVKPHTASMVLGSEGPEPGSPDEGSGAGDQRTGSRQPGEDDPLARVPANTLGGDQPVVVERWSGELAAGDAFVLTSGAVWRAAFAVDAPTPTPRQDETADAFAGRLISSACGEERGQSRGGSVVVAKLAAPGAEVSAAEAVEGLSASKPRTTTHQEPVRVQGAVLPNDPKRTVGVN